MKKIIVYAMAVVISAVFTFFFSCVNESLVEPQAEPEQEAAAPEGIGRHSTRGAMGPGQAEAQIVYNPYSLENILAWLEEQEPEQQGGETRSGGTGGIRPGDITVTHLYIRFRPATDEQYYLILNDSTIYAKPYPFDVEVPVGATGYTDYDQPEGQPPFLFAIVPIESFKSSLQGLPLDILDQLVDMDLPDAMLGAGLITHFVQDAFRGSFEISEENRLIDDLFSNPGGGSSGGGSSGGDLYPDYRGKIQVWDDDLEAYVPIEGIKVNIVRSGIFNDWHTTTKADGTFRITNNEYKSGNYVDFEFVWNKGSAYSIFTGSFGAAFYDSGPTIGHTLDLNIGGPDDNSGSAMQIHYATVWRAARRYFYGNTGGLGNIPRNRNVKIAVHDNSGTSMMLEWFTFSIPKVKEYTQWEGVGYKGTRAVISTAFHELGHVQHFYIMKEFFDFSALMNDIFDVNYTIVESWATFVEWHLMLLEYQELGHEQEILDRWRTEHNPYGKQACPYEGFNSSTIAGQLSYSSLFIDLVDAYNQDYMNTRPAGMTLHYPDDLISSYTPAELVSLLYLMRGNLSTGNEHIWSIHNDIKFVLKNNKPSGVTNAQIDQLFEVYDQYWVGPWIEGLWR